MPITTSHQNLLDPQPVVNSPSGAYLGKVVSDGSEYGTTFNFLGIRYAEPPVGHLRFKDPVPLAPPLAAPFHPQPGYAYAPHGYGSPLQVGYGATLGEGERKKKTPDVPTPRDFQEIKE